MRQTEKSKRIREARRITASINRDVKLLRAKVKKGETAPADFQKQMVAILSALGEVVEKLRPEQRE